MGPPRRPQRALRAPAPPPPRPPRSAGRTQSCTRARPAHVGGVRRAIAGAATHAPRARTGATPLRAPPFFEGKGRGDPSMSPGGAVARARRLRAARAGWTRAEQPHIQQATPPPHVTACTCSAAQAAARVQRARGSAPHVVCVKRPWLGERPAAAACARHVDKSANHAHPRRRHQAHAARAPRCPPPAGACPAQSQLQYSSNPFRQLPARPAPALQRRGSGFTSAWRTRASAPLGPPF